MEKGGLDLLQVFQNDFSLLSSFILDGFTHSENVGFQGVVLVFWVFQLITKRCTTALHFLKLNKGLEIISQHNIKYILHKLSFNFSENHKWQSWRFWYSTASGCSYERNNIGLVVDILSLNTPQGTILLKRSGIKHFTLTGATETCVSDHISSSC